MKNELLNFPLDKYKNSVRVITMKTYYIALTVLTLIGLFMIGVSISTFVTHRFIGYGIFDAIVGGWMIFRVIKELLCCKCK